MRLEKSIVINRPIEAVFAYITDMTKVELWLPVKNVQQTSTGPLGVGSTFSQTVEFMGQRFPATIQITTYQPPTGFAFKLIDAPFPLTTQITLASVQGGTNLSMVTDTEPGKALKLAGPFVTPMIKKQMDTQANTLKKLVEAQ